MASSYIEWDSPDINLDNETIMKAFFKDFDDRMQESGLIKIVEETIEYTQPAPFTTNSYNQSRNVATYTYKFPKGYAKTEFEDVTNQTYKKIKRASYFKTNTQIQFKFIYFKSTSTPPVSGKEFNSTTILYCDLLIRRNTGDVFQLVSAMGNYCTYNGSVSFGDGVELVHRKNYLIHTEDTFILSWGNMRYPSAALPTVYQSPNCVIGMCLRRSKDYDAFCVLTPSADRVPLSSAPYAMKLTTSLNGSFEQYDFLGTTRNFFNWQQESTNAVEDGESVIYPIMDIFSNIKGVNSSFYITKNIPETPILAEDNAVILYRDTPVLVSTIFFGKYSKTFMYGLNIFAFMAIKPNYEVITGDLI